jgi:hypothetical protein
MREREREREREMSNKFGEFECCSLVGERRVPVAADDMRRRLSFGVAGWLAARAEPALPDGMVLKGVQQAAGHSS